MINKMNYIFMAQIFKTFDKICINNYSLINFIKILKKP